MSADLKSIQELDINEIQPNPLQPRGAIAPDTLMELVDSIKEHGILEPLVIAHTPAGYQIIAGERRWRAAKLVGLKVVPCIIKETSPQNMLEMAIVENVQREDLNALDRAKAFERLLQEFGLNHAGIAERIGKSQAYVSNTLKLLELPDALKDGLLTGMISEGHARALLAIQHKQTMIEAYKQVLRESASVRRAEDIARRLKAKLDSEGITKKRNNELAPIFHERFDQMREDMEKKLGENSKVKLVRSTRQTKVLIVLNGSPEETEEKLQHIYKGLTSAK
jgi:ParB family chromosome partitioning protein